MKGIIYRIKAAWFILRSESFILTARRGERIMHGMDCYPVDPIVAITMRKVGETVVEAAQVIQVMKEAGDAVSKLKDEMGIPNEKP